MDQQDTRAQQTSRHAVADSSIYKLLIENIQDYAIFFMDQDGYIRTWNKGAERSKGYKDTEIIGRHFSVFYTQDDIDAGKPERELRIATKLGHIEDEDWRIRKAERHRAPGAGQRVRPVLDQKNRGTARRRHSGEVQARPGVHFSGHHPAGGGRCVES